MKYNQRDVVEVNFLLPNGQFKPHPAIIVSNDELQEAEGFVYLVLVSSKNYQTEYCYPISDDMLSCKMAKKSYAKCHIITANMERDIIRKLGTMKEKYFKEMKEKIILSIF